MSTRIPIFPLHSVLFPMGVLPLKIFEPRYLEMISDCFKTDSGFGVCLIKNGSEVGDAADIYDVGTVCEVSYFNRQADGLLGITAEGKQRFHILSKEVMPNQLIIADVELIPNEEEMPITQDHSSAAKILQHLFDQLGYPFIKMEKRYHDASWVSCRLAELLPLDLQQKQALLQINNASQRLESIWLLLKELELRQPSTVD